MKIFYDFDGVIRLLAYSVFKREPKTWDENPYPNCRDYNFIEHYTYNPEFQYYAPPSKYLSTILRLRKQGVPIDIVSYQIPEWRQATSTWCRHYIDGTWGIHWVDNFEKKFEYMKTWCKNDDSRVDDFLIVDDYPMFKDYKNVILIDKPYNQDVKKPYKRIKTCRELYDCIMEIV